MAKLSDFVKITVSGGRYSATLVGADWVHASGKSADEACSALMKTVADHVENVFSRRYAFSKDGRTVFCLYRAVGCWAYDVMKPGYQTPSSCQFSEKVTFEDAMAKMLAHAEQY